jgi:hypothetical protein
MFRFAGTRRIDGDNGNSVELRCGQKNIVAFTFAGISF